MTRRTERSRKPADVRHEDLLAHAFLGLRRFRRIPLRVGCASLDARLMQDGLDLFLGLFGNRQRDWVDRAGREAAGRGVWPAGARVARELLWSVPRTYLRHRRQVARMLRELGTLSDPMVPALERALFIRSDHAFAVRAGGSVGHIAGVIRGLRGHGLDVRVLSSDTLPGVERDERFLLEPPVYEPVRNFPAMPELLYTDQLTAAALARCAAARADLVYQRYSLNNYTGPLLRSRWGVPFVCEYNGSIVWMFRHWEAGRLYMPGLATRIELLNLLAADLVVVVSQAMADEVLGRGVPPEKVLVNPNGVDADVYRPDVDGSDVRARYALHGRTVVGFIGTFGPWHGAETLVRAAAALRDRPDIDLADLRFLLIGDGARMPAVRQAVRDLDLGEAVVLTGLVPQDQGPAHLAACDILVAPHVPNPDGTPFFGSPTKLFEYMAMGRGIVASDLDQIGDVLEHGQTAWLVTPGDAEALADGIVGLLDPELRRRLGGRAREVALERHTWDAHTRRILDALRERVVRQENA
ncbi:MAG TPA: glycosyltransferase [Longimicrobiales bacterium]|nr:glycosyltransferase [Longimicrobiales bacterium]